MQVQFLSALIFSFYFLLTLFKFQIYLSLIVLTHINGLFILSGWEYNWLEFLLYNLIGILQKMISCYLENKSPEKAKLRMNLQTLSSMVTMNCKQTHDFKIHYDDITYENKIINKIMLCGIIISYRDGLSPTKKPVRIIKLRDSSGICNLQLFQSKEWEMIPQLVKCKNRPYVTVCAQAKSQGQFRYEIKLTIISLNIVKDYNQISLHLMTIIKDYLALKS